MRRKSIICILVPVDDNRLLIGGSDRLVSLRAAKNNSSNPKEKDVRNVRKIFERTFPHLSEVPFSHVWNGIIPSAIDNIPLTGEFQPDHYLVIYSPGLPNAFSCGKILAKLLLEETHDTYRSKKIEKYLSQTESGLLQNTSLLHP